MNAMRKIKYMLALMRFLPVLPGLDWKDDRFRKDLARWKEICHTEGSDPVAAALLLWDKQEFRNLLLYRNRNRMLFRYWIRLFYRPMASLYIQTPEIGGGLFIQHGFATMIAAKSIGENCWINQQVTIGYGKGTQPPVIGDHVTITCGAKVLGEIRVGDGAVIGANAVVIRDVEPNAVMGGVPARSIR